MTPFPPLCLLNIYSESANFGAFLDPIHFSADVIYMKSPLLVGTKTCRSPPTRRGLKYARKERKSAPSEKFQRDELTRRRRQESEEGARKPFRWTTIRGGGGPSLNLTQLTARWTEMWPTERVSGGRPHSRPRGGTAPATSPRPTDRLCSWPPPVGYLRRVSPFGRGDSPETKNTEIRLGGCILRNLLFIMNCALGFT